MFGFFHKKKKESVKSTPYLQNRKMLFDLLQAGLDAGVEYCPVRDLDNVLTLGKSVVFLKHDVHELPLGHVEIFAQEQARLGVFGTYFFMAPGHPQTEPFYSPGEQMESMFRIQELGHEVGLHIDPYFLIHLYQKGLPQILGDILKELRAGGLQVCTANMHGHSNFKGLDKNGFGTSFDFFQEIGRQPDFPNLSAVDENLKQTIVDNRLELKEFSIMYWADMPLWSKNHNYVVTNYLSDNLLGKKQEFQCICYEDTFGSYRFSDYQPPGVRKNTGKPTGHLRVSGNTWRGEPLGLNKININDPGFGDYFINLCRSPLQVLLHPQHYIKNTSSR